MSRWHWRSEESLSRGMEGARRCNRIWHLQSPLAGFAARIFVYADGERSIYFGPEPNGQMSFLDGFSGRFALANCVRSLRLAWAKHIVRQLAGVDA